MPLNIDWQQILLHWMNLAILIGGLYFLLYKPVRQFMSKRVEYYRDMDRQAQDKLSSAEQLREEYQARLDRADEEILRARERAQHAAQEAADARLAEADAQAHQIIVKAKTEAENTRERIRSQSQRELRELASAAARKLVLDPEADPFDQFLDLAEGGEGHESR